MRWFIGQGQSGSLVTWPFTQRLHRFAPAPVVVHGFATAPVAVPIERAFGPIVGTSHVVLKVSPNDPRTAVILWAERFGGPV
jgi:hypothetical protein